VVLAVAATSLLGLWSPADSKLAELRFAGTTRAPSGEIVFVDIDARSLAKVGLWPWPRSIHAQLLDDLMTLGAYEVALDIDFSAASTPLEDQALAASLERAGGYAFLGSFRQTDANGALVVNRPLPQFAQYAKSVLVNVDELEGGLVRAVPSESVDLPAKSVALTFSPDAAAHQGIRIDYGIDLQQVPRVAAIDILDGSVDPALIRDRQIVVGASAIELHDLFATPRFGIIPGAMVQVGAAETLKLGRGLTNLSIWPALAFIAVLALGLSFFRRVSLVKLVLALAAIAVATELAAVGALSIWKLDMATMPVHVGCLVLALLRLLEERVDRYRQLQEHRARLAYLANHDVRTGAMSRTAWIDAVDAALEGGTTTWVVLLRLGGLDTAGASLGFEVVEEAIAMAHGRLRDMTPGIVARIESDTFAGAWPHPPSTAEVQQLLAALERPYEVGGHRLALQARWGSSGDVSNAIGARQGLQQAQMALSAAGNSGLSGAGYEARFGAELQRRQLIDIGLRKAVANGELDIAFQTQVDMQSKRIVGLEALLRWNSGTMGRISPADFIPMAEENGTIVELGAWVFSEACRRAVHQGWTGRLSINVSPLQFQHDDVVAMIRSALADTGFPADRLDIEITESLFADDGNRIVPALEALRLLGAQIAIDDFGTGYSSLSQLSGLPVDKLKIDQSFVRQMADQRGAGVLEAIVSLGQKLGLRIVVEGVETQSELDHLASMGCHIAQGFLFGRPGDLPAGVDSEAA
jgi:EAL domain-containing protein (putative c-di-GMP-specific phosphodiesterase class I)/CHASE2 domain-containing sensor protein/GGDEF domain-containing protein